ncbi:MAG: GMC family oxidoreductase [Actinobacteria bacterium]|nr:GMC family oxidoreductase [Actinomycetota bacterium]MCL6104924.1 GMC family oxidoreductase [Actinomycetota bacterium]
MSSKLSSALESLSSLILPPEYGGPEPTVFVPRFKAFLDAQPKAVSIAVYVGATLVNTWACLTTGHSLSSLPPSRREQVLEGFLRHKQTALALEGLKTLVLLVAGSERFKDEILASAKSTSPARPDAVLDIASAEWWPSRSRFDAVIVGSGAGGAMAARTLARKGMAVLIVEEGARHGVEEFRTVHPLERFASIYRDGGSTMALGVPPVVLPIGRAVGGTTVINSGTCYRTPEEVMLRWRDEEGFVLADPELFNPYLDEVEATLEVAPVRLEVMGENGKLALEGAKALGWKASPLLRNAPGCGGCCQCAIGCPRNAKFGVHLNALPQACQDGAKILSDARVDKILLENGHAKGVVARRKGGSSLIIHADVVVVACGATETPLLLRRSGIGKHPKLGHNLAIHPGVGVGGRFEEEVVAWRGVLQSAGIEEFHEKYGILIEATSTPPGMGSIILQGYGKHLLDELDNSVHLATLGAMVADGPAGRVIGNKNALIFYNLMRKDGKKLIKAIEVMAKLLFAAGAKEVMTGIPGVAPLHKEDQIESALSNVNFRDLHLAAFHPTGTAAAGSNPDNHPVLPDGRLRGVQGVWLADASILPTCPTVNPQVSIMAAALAVADGISKPLM